ncbi:MAG: peptidoglycan editing factor PgeF [Campylobacterales bacterium]|nr:peptidoglycan editing factor PgeF [Campylobacterales bacterium]
MQFHQSTLLKPFSNLICEFTSKEDGNLAFHVEDSEGNVIKNHKLLANRLHYEYTKLIHMKQIHSNLTHTITEYDNFFTPPTCDALITNIPKKPLMVMVADCAPILFYDPKRSVIAVAHAGRAGAFSNIIQNVVNSFIKEYQSSPQDIYVSVGTMIHECCYEVGQEIVLEAKELGYSYAITKKESRYFLNIPKILKDQLKNAGIKEDNSEFSSYCSACSTNTHYSYRAEGNTGRFAGVIMLKD